MEKEILRPMFDNLLHIGNKKNFWNPRMKPYIYGESNWVHIINLIKTDEKINEVKERLQELTKQWKKILFVTTKIQWRDAFKKLAIDTNNYYVDEKWVPGLLTNFKTIKRRISAYLKYLKDNELWEFDTLTKKEKASKLLELEKLDKTYGGLKEMKKIPDIIFVVDGIYEYQAIKEAKTLDIECIAIFNTNGDDIDVANCIPANTNSPKSLNFIAQTLKSSIVSTSNTPKSEWIKKMSETKQWRKDPVKKVDKKDEKETKKEVSETKKSEEPKEETKKEA